MTAHSSRLIRFAYGEAGAARVRLVTTKLGLTAEITQLMPIESGMEAAEARVRVPLTHVDELVAALVSTQEEAEALAARKPPRRPLPQPAPKSGRRYHHALRDQLGDDF